MESPVKGLDMSNGTTSWMRRKYPKMYNWKPDLSKVTSCSFDDEAFKGDSKIDISPISTEMARKS